MDKVMEDHIKYEAEESERLAQQMLASDHVWEEVVIDDSNEPGWEEEVEAQTIEEEVTAEDTVMQEEPNVSMAAQEVDNSQTETVEHNTVTVPEEMVETEVDAAVESIEEVQSSPVITRVKSLATKPIQKFVNFNNIKLMPKGSFVNIGNKKMQLVTLTKDNKFIPGKIVSMSPEKKLVPGKVVIGNTEKRFLPGKVVRLSGGENRILTTTGKLVPIGDRKMMQTKVVKIPSSNLGNANVVNNRVVPAKVVTIANEVKQETSNKEVTIYITGLAGDKVQIRDKLQLNKLQIGDRVQLGQREMDPETEGWRSDHIDACLPTDGSEIHIVNPNDASEGHFLLETEAPQPYDLANLTCNICDRQFTQLKYLLSHQQTHMMSEPVNCELCGKTFKRRYDLLRHKRRSHPEVDTMYQCDVCQKTFTDRLVANRHRLMHSEDFKYCCEVCNRPFKMVHDLKRHRSIHYDEKPFECEICYKKFKHKSNLKTHQATHYSEKPYSCTLCDKRFHQKGNLKTHLIVHTGEMPFVCNICNKRFHTRSGLLNHSYSHSDDKPFQCDICEKTFNWKSGLLTHQQTHRQRVVPEEVQVIEIGPIHGEM
ncbi:zinc finger protein 583-like [Macrosteles quadrilineatus]|uniref:zinc finger protein 583-like n=1 Tax=Macrosteles quadrilineatus TaxID=74068 RepID=UPI0023E2FB05|nr:zinc finger protein 583-like [Macrosteles quadrilineatus]XP_054284922.1 zinc finger protein 583-like [Macrosteles quadrilineatus]